MCACENNEAEIHLGFVALLRTQPRSRSVKLLGYDAQKLGLVLRSVAVRRADVHHLEKDGDTRIRKDVQRRGGQRDRRECQEGSELTAEENKEQERAEVPYYSEERFLCSCMVGGGGGQPAVTHWTRQEASFTCGNSKTTVGQLLQETVCKSQLCGMQWSLVPKRWGKEVHVISRLQCG